MSQANVGQLILKSIPSNTNEAAVVNYLAKLYKTVPREKLTGLVKKLPLVLGKKVPEKNAKILVAKLKQLGAIAVYTPPTIAAQKKSLGSSLGSGLVS